MITLNCQHCRTPFKTWPAEVRKGHAKYCSRSCLGSARWVQHDYAGEFWARVDRSQPDGCWPWLGMLGKGYGVVRWKTRAMKAHRVALALTDGDWSNELDVCHTCDNPACCNPAHLWRGTAAQNIQDSIEKGRFRPQDRPQSGAKLTEPDVIFIRASPETGVTLAKHFGVRRQAISKIRTGTTWKYLP
jgi:hypothetical protein